MKTKTRININNEKEGFAITRGLKRDMRRIAKTVFKGEFESLEIMYPPGRAGGTFVVELLFTSNEEITEINHDTRGVDKVTDVLSFPLLEFKEGKIRLHEEDFIGRGKALYLGEIVIAPDVMAEQSISYGHSVRRELCFLFSHGLFHLLGYDHSDNESERRMIGKQEEVLKALKITRHDQ